MFSIVIPLRNEEGCVEALWRRLHPVLSRTARDYEVIFVDDASTDRTWQSITRIHQNYPEVKGIRLGAHAGHQVTFFAGLQAASGEAIIMMDGDLQHPPEFLPELIQNWREGFDLVYGFKTGQPGRSRVKKNLNQFFHRLSSLRWGISLHPETSDFQIMDHSLVEAVVKGWHPSIFLRLWIHGQARRKKGIPFRAEPRFSGNTKQNIASLFWLGVQAFFLSPHLKRQPHLTPLYSVRESLGLNQPVERRAFKGYNPAS